MLPYTAGDGLQVIAREYGIFGDLAKESESNSSNILHTVWRRMMRSFLLPKAA
jgi:hypothetical protein